MVGAGMAAGGVTVKLVLLRARPPRVSTAIGPLPLAGAEKAVVCVGESTRKATERPLKNTEVAPCRFVPVRTTVVPAGPLVGVKLARVGAAAAVTVKAVLLALPAGFTTVIGPLVTSTGTTMLSTVS